MRARRRLSTGWRNFAPAASCSGFTRLEDGELALRIEPRSAGAAVVMNAHSPAAAPARAESLLESS
jgi:hypothetical protein